MRRYLIFRTLLQAVLVITAKVAYGEITEVWCTVGISESPWYLNSAISTKCKIGDNSPVYHASYDPWMAFVAKTCCIAPADGTEGYGGLWFSFYYSQGAVCIAETDGILTHELIGCMTGPLYCYITEHGRRKCDWNFSVMPPQICRYCWEPEQRSNASPADAGNPFSYFKYDSPFDLDGDGDVDLKDFGIYQNAYSIG